MESNLLDETMDVVMETDEGDRENENEFEDSLDEMQIAWDELQRNISEGTIDQTGVISSYISFLSNDRTDEKAVKIKEQTLYKLTLIYTESSQFDAVLNLIEGNNSLFNAIPKAKTAKIVRTVIDIVATVPDSLDLQISLCKSVIDWCKVEKRTFLRQRIESKLGMLLLQKKDSLTALSLVSSLLSELKKLDDKQMLAEVHLTEARIHHALRNIPKAKAALTASRTSSNAIYVAPALQAELDEMSGMLQCEESDYITAYSYFLEAHDGYEQSKDMRAVTCLQYMILSKVLQGDVKNLNLSTDPISAVNSIGIKVNVVSDLTSLLSSSKVAMKYSSGSLIGEKRFRALEAMIHVAKAASLKSLDVFKQVVQTFSDVFESDYLISHNLEKLYDKMLEENLLKIIQCYSCVEIAHVAKKINLSVDTVERKLSQMILDHRFSGILDQGKGELIIFPLIKEDQNMKKGIEIIANMTAAVQTLSHRAKNLHAPQHV